MKIKIYVQKVYSVILAYMLSFSALLNLINGLLNAIGLQTVLDTMILYGAMFSLIFFGITLTLDRSDYLEIDIFLFVSFFALYYLISELLFPANRVFLFTSWKDFTKNPIYLLFVYSLPGYVFARKLVDYECFKKIMRGFSYVVVSMSIMVFFFAKGSSASQYLTFSYNMLTQLFFLIFFSPSKNKMIHYLIVILGLISFTLGGARGALVCLIIAVGWMCSTIRKTKKGLLIATSISISGLFIVILKNKVILLITNLLEYFSINSRSIRYMMEGEFLNDSGRLSIFAAGKQAIGLIGKGFMGDRVAIGIYPHNLVLEMLVHFGVLLGMVLVAILLLLVCFALLSKNTPEYVWIIMLFPCGFLKLMITGSYLNQEPAFYILLGLCVNAMMRRSIYENTDDQHCVRRGKHWKNY